MPQDINKNGIQTTANALQPENNPVPHDLRSAEVVNIISARPGFWGRWAMICFLLIFLLLIAGAWFIWYPETITADGLLTATHLPQKITSHGEGRLTAIYGKDGDMVSINDSIGGIETDTGHLVIKAPASGKIAFTMMAAKNKWLQNGEVLGYVDPANNHYYVRLHFAQHDLGRLNAEQQVQLRVTAYPYEEFGFLQGKIDYNSIEVTDKGFYVNVELLNGLNTTLNRSVRFHNGLQVRALIVTRQMRLLQRFYYSMWRRAGR